MKKLLLIAAASLCAALTGCGSSSSAPAAEDSGVVWCKQLAATAASPESQDDGAAPTDELFKTAEQHWNDSTHSDLKRAGLAHLKAVKAYYDSDGALQDVVVKRASLNATCAKYGVKIADPVMPSFSPEPLPTLATLPDQPLPTNPYGN